MEEESQPQDKLFARLNGKHGEHLVVFTDRQTMTGTSLQRYNTPQITTPIEFKPGRTLHDDEWYFIELDDEQQAEMIAPYTNNANTASDNRTIGASEYAKVVALYKTNGRELLVTKVSAGMRVESKTFIGLNEHPEITSYQKAIEFTGVVDAYYDSDGKLYFKHYSKIRSLFPGIEAFYRDATAEEKNTFLGKSFFDIQGIDADTIGMRDSQKIAEILDDDRMRLDDTVFQQSIITYAREYAPELASDDGKLKITDKATLHKSLNVLTDRYYTSGLFGDKREAIDSTKIDT